MHFPRWPPGADGSHALTRPLGKVVVVVGKGGINNNNPKVLVETMERAPQGPARANTLSGFGASESGSITSQM